MTPVQDTTRSANRALAGAAALGGAFGAGILVAGLAAHHRLRRLQRRLAHAQTACAQAGQRARDAEHHADHDPLTGLLNRHGLQRRLEHADPSGVLVLIDLDGFKQVNDDYGHDAGDALLAEIGRRLRAAARRGHGHAARLGGDEFLLALPLPPGSAAETIESVLDTLTRPVAVRVTDGPIIVHPALCAGLAARTGHAWADALRAADIAVYHAKRDPARRLVVHCPGMRHPAGPQRLRDRRAQTGRDS